MIRIPVLTHLSYEIQIERGLLRGAGEAIQRALPGAARAFLVYDRELRDLYRDDLLKSLREAGLEVFAFSLPGGESTKSLDTIKQLTDALSERGLSRSDALICLGGGSLSDVGGLAAALYLRGIRYVNIPTTLLAMVDASVGGKVGINTRAGKNQLGAFHQPSLVLVDPNLLGSLDDSAMVSGKMECLKYALIADESLLETVCAESFDAEAVIASCLQIKADIVADDELDHGERRLLNFGHTVGHALEALTGYELSHGEAVALGMQVIARAAQAAGHCGKDTPDRIRQAVERIAQIPMPEVSVRQLVTAIQSDKKRAGSLIELVVPEAVGRARRIELPMASLDAFLRPALRKPRAPKKP